MRYALDASSLLTSLARVVVTVVLAVLALTSTLGAAAAPERPIAPELSGLGTVHMPVTTDQPKAQQFFDQGLRLLYAFNHQEARRAFEEAARLDRSLAMAYWGQAMTLAVNLNAPMPAASAVPAFEAIERARAHVGRASARERALVEALAARLVADPGSPRPPLDLAYAAAMAGVAAAHPRDPDVLTLYADAVMNTMPWNYWQPDGALKPELVPATAALEQAMVLHPDHAGAHHYYVHLWEGSRTPERAEPSADRLGALMPAAGHVVHMPAHIYLRVGRYADAAEANVRAIAADEDYLAQCQAQGLYPVSYYPHNLHFLWAAATLEGRSTVAIDAARQVAAKVPHHHAGALAWTADFPVTPWLAYVRFGHWQQMLTEPRPPVTEPYATGIWHYARGLAFIARDQQTRAATELEALTEVMKHQAFQTTLKELPLLANLQIASRIVRGELEGRSGRRDDAVRTLQEATAMEDALPYSEPPIWHQPVRQVLGAVLVEAGRPIEAESVYREDLARVRENGWSLFGLWQSLAAQGKTTEAERARARFEKTWARATITLTSSRVMAAARSSRPDEAGRSAQVQEGPMEKSVSLPNGVTLRYAEQGQASGVPVLFLHGVTDSWRSFEPVLRQLPPSVHAFALTQRGHGDSSRPESGYRYSDMSEDALAFMDVMGLPAAVVVGHSMGAMVAQRLAIDHPGRIAGLVLMGAFHNLQASPAVQEFWNTVVSTLRDPIDPAMVREFQTGTVSRKIPEEFLDTVVNESLKIPARVWQATFNGFLQTPDFSAQLATVSSPTLIVWGDRDSYALRKDQEALGAAIPHARLLVYEGGGHAFHWETPDRFAEDLVAFICEPHRDGVGRPRPSVEAARSAEHH